jgi:glycosyltransferase involved in cell wall biosynthesis
MKIALIGTYPPRKCGIGTFTNNLLRAIAVNINDRHDLASVARVIAINEDEQDHDYPEEVMLTIRQNRQRDYITAAKKINFSDADVCILEHEFGIFGGDDGVFILSLIHRLELPLIVTLHTVLNNPSYTQRSIIEEIGARAARITVMSKRAIDFLTNIYSIPQDKIDYIEHGVPDFKKASPADIKKKYNFEGRKVILTFGLISRNKGIETVINALPDVVRKYPELLYIISGKTHPEVVKHSGEEYRGFLHRLVKQHGIEKNVFFNNEFLTEKQLFEYLTASDIYITPYLTEAQITSGTLSYAIGTGSAVVSTPYWHAQELLDDGRGRLFDFKNSGQLSEVILDLFDDEKKIDHLKTKAYEYGKKIRWPKIGKQYLSLSEYIYNSWDTELELKKIPIQIPMLPRYNLAHVNRLTDDTGIVQHAKYGIPNLKEGYCLDDNSRALLMALMAYRQNKDKEALELIPVYLSFIHYLQRDNGNFGNFLSFSRQFLDEYGSEDSFGRTVWALGFLISNAPNDSFKQIGREIYGRSVQYFDKLGSLRGIANIIIGIAYYLKDAQEDEPQLQLLLNLTSKLVDAYMANREDNWHWFEDTLSYDNGILPLAMFHAAEITQDDRFLNIANESLEFLENITFSHGCLSPVGNMGWYQKGGELAEYDQQSIDAMAMVLLYHQAYMVTKNREYIDKLFTSYMWFLGDNSLRLPLYDHETCGCNDGLESTGVNRNQGAESTLAYWISHLTVLVAQEKEFEYIE